MVIEVEAFFGDCYLWGKESDFSEIKKQMDQILSEVNETDFVDTHKIYKPQNAKTFCGYRKE